MERNVHGIPEEVPTGPSPSISKDYLKSVLTSIFAMLKRSGLTTDFKNNVYLLLRITLFHLTGRRIFPNVGWIVAALVYCAAPWDILPDTIVIVGLTDDAAVVSWILNKLRNEINDFKVWERAQPDLPSNTVMFQEFVQGFNDNARTLLEQVKSRLANIQDYMVNWNANKPKPRTDGKKVNAEGDNSCCRDCVIS